MPDHVSCSSQNIKCFGAQKLTSTKSSSSSETVLIFSARIREALLWGKEHAFDCNYAFLTNYMSRWGILENIRYAAKTVSCDLLHGPLSLSTHGLSP
jgi:hypothetical protein